MTRLRREPIDRAAGSAGRAALLVLVVVALATGQAGAATHKILVLPVDGTADTATRSKLTSRIVKLARTLDGQVATADATFADTALAVGCDPQAAGCSDLVIATLGVDELVWGTASKSDGRTRLIVRRASKGSPPREVVTTIAAGESTDQIDAGMAPLFVPPGAAREPVVAAPNPPPEPAPVAARDEPAAPAAPAAPPASVEDHGDRNLGIGLVAGGGVALGLGFALWSKYSSLQDSIDGHPTRNRADFDDLTALESRAASYAIAGDVLVVAGLAAGGLGAYYLYRNHRRHHVAILPAPIGHGAGLTLTIIGGP